MSAPGLTRRRLLAGTAASALILAIDPAALAAPMQDADAPAPDTEWRSYAADKANTRYSPLDQINADNFNDLEIAWSVKTDVFGARKEPWLELESPDVDGVTLIGEPVPQEPPSVPVEEALDGLADLSVNLPYADSASSLPARPSMVYQAQPLRSATMTAARPSAKVVSDEHPTVAFATKVEAAGPDDAGGDVLAAVPVVKQPGYRARSEPNPMIDERRPSRSFASPK